MSGGGRASPPPRRLPPHVMQAYQVRNELGRLIADRNQRSAPLPHAVAIAFVLARVAVVTERGGVDFDTATRLAARLGAPLPDERALMEEVHRAGAEGARLGRAWRLPSPDTLGVMLGITEDERTRLRLRRIGSCEMTTAERRRDRDRKRKENKRSAEGGTPRSPYSEPWVALGISRATYFRRKRASDFKGNRIKTEIETQ